MSEREVYLGDGLYCVRGTVGRSDCVRRARAGTMRFSSSPA
jgi:hypothetical protein